MCSFISLTKMLSARWMLHLEQSPKCRTRAIMWWCSLCAQEFISFSAQVGATSDLLDPYPMPLTHGKKAKKGKSWKESRGMGWDGSRGSIFIMDSDSESNKLTCAIFLLGGFCSFTAWGWLSLVKGQQLATNLLVEGLWWNAKDNVTFSTKFHCTIVVLPETPPEADTFLYVIIIHTHGFHGEELEDSLPYNPAAGHGKNWWSENSMHCRLKHGNYVHRVLCHLQSIDFSFPFGLFTC